MMQVNQRNRWCQIWREQRGSHALEASGVAVGAALVAVALLMAVQLITLPGMQRTLDCAVAIVLGGSGCGGTAGSGGGAAQPSAVAPSTSDGPNGARTAASIGLDVIPVVGEIKGLIEVFTGTDLVTGEDLGWWRFAGLAGLVGLNEIKLLRHGDEVVDLVRRGDELLDTGGDAARRADDVVPPCKLGARPTGKAHGLAAPLQACVTAQDVLNRITSGTSKADLEAELAASRWTSAPAQGGAKSGTGLIWTSPDGTSSVRIMTRPDGTSYARVYNGPGGGAPGEQALNASGKPGSKADTHFELTP